jgi:hypothetical protein
MLKNIWIDSIYYNKEIKNMTSFKKPLIAIVSAVALAASAILATPANATVSAVVTVGVTDVSTTAKVSTTPATPTVPSDNKVDLADTVKFVVTVPTGTIVRATATDAKLVTALDSADASVSSASGSASVEINTGSGTTATIYAFTTKTTAGSVVVSVGGSSTTYFLKGVAGPAYNVAVSVPAVANLSADVDFTATATDVFGNAVENATITTTLLRGTVKTALTWNATDKLYKGVITTPATAGSVSGIAKITATDVAGLSKSVSEATFSLVSADLATQVATLTASLATAQAALASAKKKHNALAKKWNKKFPKNKVKLIK